MEFTELEIMFQNQIIFPTNTTSPLSMLGTRQSLLTLSDTPSRYSLISLQFSFSLNTGCVSWKRLLNGSTPPRYFLYRSFIYAKLKFTPNTLSLNSVLNSRLSLAQNGYFDYGIKLFGNYIEMEGNSALEEAMEYFYIDSGFAYSLLGYGLLFTLVAMALYSILFYYSCKTNNKAMFVWILSIWIFSFVNNVWVSVDINPILVLSLMALTQLGIKKKSSNMLNYKAIHV